MSPDEGRHFRAKLCVVVALYLSVGHLRVWVSAAPTELLILMFSVSPGFHIGLRPHSTLGYAGVSPLQGSLLDWLVCFWGGKWIVAFGRVFV